MTVANMRTVASQPRRAVYLLLYLALLIIINRLAFQTWVPLSGERGLWFGSALLALLLGNLLVTPFFTSPANAISYASAVLVSAGLLPPLDTPSWRSALYWVLLSFLSLILLSSLAAILFKDYTDGRRADLARICRLLADRAGHPRTIFPLVALYTILAFHLESPRETVALAVAGVLVSVSRPVEGFDRLLQSIKHQLLATELRPKVVADLVADESPATALLHQHEGESLLYEILVAANPDATPRLFVPVAKVGTHFVRALDVPVPDDMMPALARITSRHSAGTVLRIPTELADQCTHTSRLVARRHEIVGITAPQTSVSTLYFDVFPEGELEVGVLLQVDVRATPTLYQVIDCTNRKESLQGRDTHAYSRGQARKIGAWNDQLNRFDHVSWLPRPNAPVLLAEGTRRTSDSSTVGHFPQSNYGVQVASVSDMVTHNTAILGILGIGKTFLALELVERMIAEDIKVICLDLTDQYQEHLSQYYDADAEEASLERLQQAAREHANGIEENPEEGGSLPALRRALDEDVMDFLKSNRVLKVYNPATFPATKQLYEPRSVKVGGNNWRRVAAVWNASPVEITREVAESILAHVGDEFREHAHVCLVLEEAHALVPEWNTVADERDRAAAAGTARALLQGRKFGYGCLVVTQRTANVFKTVLNQCNSIFAMRSFDDTGKQFLANYIGSEYAGSLPSLRTREAIFFGKCSSCEDPVLIRLNDRRDFIVSFGKTAGQKGPTADRSINP